MTCPDPSGILPIQILFPTRSVTQPDRRVLQMIPSNLSPHRPAQPRQSDPSATPNPPPQTSDRAKAPQQTKTSVSTPHTPGSSHLSLSPNTDSQPDAHLRGPTHDPSKRSSPRTRTANTHAMIKTGALKTKSARALVRHDVNHTSCSTQQMQDHVPPQSPLQRRRKEKTNANRDPQRDPTSRKT